MQMFSIPVFDQIISGTGVSWYTSAALNDQLGAADQVAFQAVTTKVSGTSPTLTCQMEHSGDGRNWLPFVAGTPEVDAQPIFNDANFLGMWGIFDPPPLRFLRIKVFLGGILPECRLKLYATGRDFRKPSG